MDHLVGLGANGLLLGPVFSSATHEYDTLDHYRIDPRLGDDDDFDALVTAAHDRGIYIGVDGVFNHFSHQHPFLLDALARGPGSRHADWFRIDWNAAGGPRPTVFEGHGALVELNHDNPEVRDYVTGVMAHWTSRGVDAWRLDATHTVDPSFWAGVLPIPRTRHPDIWAFGETIHGDYAGYVERSTIDSVTQYELWKAIWSSLHDRNFFELDSALHRHDDLLAAFVPATFIGNHDVTRIATIVGPEVLTKGIVYDEPRPGRPFVNKLPRLTGVTLITVMSTPEPIYRWWFGNPLTKITFRGTFRKIGVRNLT